MVTVNYIVKTKIKEKRPGMAQEITNIIVREFFE